MTADDLEPIEPDHVIQAHGLADDDEPTPRPSASRPKTTLASVFSCLRCSSRMTPPQLVE